MATKSIYKNVVIKDTQLKKNLVLALENAQKKTSKKVQLSKPCRSIKKEQVKDFFREQQ